MNLKQLTLSEKRGESDYRLMAEGDVIISNAGRLQACLDRALEDGANPVLLDLSGVDYIDSFGIGVVVKTKAEMDKRKGRFRVLVNRTILTLFEKCHLDDYIELELTGNEDPAR